MNKGETMTNTESFKQTFNEIETLLKKITKSDNYVSFKVLIEKAASLNRVVKSFQLDLLEYGDLRNSIVHSSTKKFLAEPYDETVSNIQRILKQIENPPKLEIFKQQGILICDAKDSIDKILLMMKERNFSQVPVYEDKVLKGLLTTDTISRWVAYELKTNEILGVDEIVGNVLGHTENPQNYKIMSRNRLLIEAVDLFEVSFEKGKSISAILVTETGSEKESLLSIITPFDIPKMEKRIRSM